MALPDSTQDDFEIRRRGEYFDYHAPQWIKTRWKSAAGLNWLIRSHKEELEASGGIVKIAGEWFIVPSKFPNAVRAVFGIKPNAPCGIDAPPIPPYDRPASK